jgi:multiple sugar transport system permease protein
MSNQSGTSGCLARLVICCRIGFGTSLTLAPAASITCLTTMHYTALFSLWLFGQVVFWGGLLTSAVAYELARGERLECIERFPWSTYVMHSLNAYLLASAGSALGAAGLAVAPDRTLGEALEQTFAWWPAAWGVLLGSLCIGLNHRRLSTRTRTRLSNYAAALFFLSPNLLGFLIFTALPIVFSLCISLCDWDLITGFGGIRYVGLDNFRQLLGFIPATAANTDVESWITHVFGVIPRDREFWLYLWNTGVFMLSIPFGIAGSLALALMLNRKIRGRIVWRTLYFLPSMCVPVAVFLLWGWLYNPDYGYINATLRLLGVDGPNWLTSVHWAKPAIMIAGFWMGVGGPTMILYLAGLQNVPRELHEAATIDGASPWQAFRHITWPLLTPTTFFIVTMSIIGGFQGHFESAYIMTGGGPAGSTTAISYYIYNNAFTWNKMGYASAIAWVLFLLVFIVSLVHYRIGGRRVHYY